MTENNDNKPYSEMSYSEIQQRIAENHAHMAKMNAEAKHKIYEFTFGTIISLAIGITLGTYLSDKYVIPAIDKAKAELKNSKTIEAKLIPAGSCIDVYDDKCLDNVRNARISEHPKNLKGF